jgi:hypothetical protein
VADVIKHNTNAVLNYKHNFKFLFTSFIGVWLNALVPYREWL